MNAKVQAKQYRYNSVSLNVPVFISKENPPNCHSSVYFKTASFSMSNQRTHDQSIKLSHASPLLTVGMAENLIITITMPASVVYFDKPPTSKYISLATQTQSLMQRIRYCNNRIGSLGHFNHKKPCTEKSTKEKSEWELSIKGGSSVKGWNSKPEASFQHV